VGHSVTLALAVTDVLVLPSRVVEFLIPVTIVATGIENLLMRDRAARGAGARHRPIFAALFGLVHGAGFAGYLKSLFMDHIALPLLGFNIGIEAGQIVVLLAAAVLFVGADGLLRTLPLRKGWPDAFQLRVLTVSAVITIVASGWAVERFPR
jgi:HupE / UreJ protein